MAFPFTGRFHLLIWPWPGGGGARPWPSGAWDEENGADPGARTCATFFAPSATWPWPGTTAAGPWPNKQLETPSKFPKTLYGVGWGGVVFVNWVWVWI